MLSYYLFISTTTSIVTFLLIWALIPVSKGLGLLDIPDERKRHQEAIPVVGGFAIYVAVVAMIALLGTKDFFIWLFLTSAIILILGGFDDTRGLSVTARFAVQFIATSIMIFCTGTTINDIGVTTTSISNIASAITFPVTLIAVVGLTNALNLSDGIDGLASGHSCIGFGCLLVMILMDHSADAYVVEGLLVITSAVIGFLLVNLSLTPLPKVFLGDSGSLTLGFVLAWFLIYHTQTTKLVEPAAALWCVSLLVFDTVTVIFKRLMARRSPFHPDRTHLHHILIDRNFSPKWALFTILVVSATVNFIGLVITAKLGSEISLAAFILVSLIFMRTSCRLN